MRRPRDATAEQARPRGARELPESRSGLATGFALDTRMSDPRPTRRRTHLAADLAAPGALSLEGFLASMLLLLIAWTLVIKYLFPMAWSLAHGLPLTQHIYWDLWPLAHGLLAWALLARPPWLRALALGMALVEIGIIVTKFALFLPDPEWSIWRTNWFINKLFVLACFVLVLVVALPRERWRPRPVEDALPPGEGR